MSRLGFREKMLYAQMVALLVVGVYYAHFLMSARPGHHYLHAVLLAVLLLFASLRWLLKGRAGSVVEDERDRLIASDGARWSNTVLWLGLIVILVVYWDHGSVHSAGLLIGVLFHLLLLAGMVRIVRELVAYRMAA